MLLMKSPSNKEVMKFIRRMSSVLVSLKYEVRYKCK